MYHHLVSDGGRCRLANDPCVAAGVAQTIGDIIHQTTGGILHQVGDGIKGAVERGGILHQTTGGILHQLGDGVEGAVEHVLDQLAQAVAVLVGGDVDGPRCGFALAEPDLGRVVLRDGGCDGGEYLVVDLLLLRW